MHDRLFETREFEIASLKQHAAALNLDTKAFDVCLDSDAMEEEVKKDFKDGRSAGITGTPAFFINGKKLVGAQPFSKFKEVIEVELNK
jgi:protein-disulfide isomerase